MLKIRNFLTLDSIILVNKEKLKFLLNLLNQLLIEDV
jgi:hypothetical protein